MKKRMTALLIMIFVLLIGCGSVAAEPGDLPLLVDDAALLTASEAQNVEAVLLKLQQTQHFDIVIVTVDDLEGKSAMAYADDYFDYNGYGYGSNCDGCLLLIHMDANSGYWISTTGYGITALTDYGIAWLGAEITPFLSAGDFEAAFIQFAYDVDALLTDAKNGEIFDDKNEYYHEDAEQEQPLLGGTLIWSILGGLLVSVLVITGLNKQMHNVSMSRSAQDYYVKGSLQLTRSYDRLAGRNVTRTRIQRDESNHGSSGHTGSSTHIGSSGTSHGGGGGRF